jgi:hypothetical protein
MAYKAWTAIDSGREGLWEPDIWLGVIKIVSKHQGEGVYDENAPIYAELQTQFPSETWKAYDNAGGKRVFRPLFRDYPKPWTVTDTVSLEGQEFRLTELGQKLVNNEISSSKVFERLTTSWREEDDRPFQVLATAMLEYGEPLSFDDVYRGIMLGYRPGDDIQQSINRARKSTSAIEKTPERRLKLLLRILKNVGAIQETRSKSWIIWDIDILRRLANVGERAPAPQKNLVGFTDSLHHDLADAGMHINLSLLERVTASLLAKRFLILTGLSGSGKTKIAEAFSAWLCGEAAETDPLVIGSKIEADRVSYRVTASDQHSVEFLNDGMGETGKLVSLPRALIREWCDSIERTGATRETSPRELREAVASTTRYSAQLNSFETHLKAAAFAILEKKKPTTSTGQYRLVPVGADWTSNEHILGYQDALQAEVYRKPPSGVLDLIIAASKNPNSPYFLILDEMNLSHVERYFADFLSALESGNEVSLHAVDKPLSAYPGDPFPVPTQITVPPNLFIIGTVNIDETTYMFSPKVLDRANVIEFRMSHGEMLEFLSKPAAVRIRELAGKGSGYAREFVAAATTDRATVADLSEEVWIKHSIKENYNDALAALFVRLSEIGAEFGFRTAHEISRYFYYHRLLVGDSWDAHVALDAQVLQKLLPKLHGSERKLGPVLEQLEKFCSENGLVGSVEKIQRMRKRLRDGFTSFAEA